MPQDLSAAQIKDRILSYVSRVGPSIPISISKQVNLSILFTNAFLSELYSEKKLRMTHMRVGSSAVYFIEGQEPQLENYFQFVKGKEKEALLLLKEKIFLKDSELEPAIRVALRQIKDFAIPFNNPYYGNGELIWRYFTAGESEFVSENKEKKVVKEEKSVIEEVKVEKQDVVVKEVEVQEIPESPKPKRGGKKILTQKSLKNISKSSKKQDDTFFNKVKEFISEKNAEILEIISAGKNELVLKVRAEGREKVLVAYNKKKISEKEIISAHKKAQEFDLPFLIMSLSDLPKKFQELIEALRTLSGIQKID